ncbi:hypothetical protein M3I54_09075 [Paraburkholderia sp. CNPSo 3274]|uniref:hypothetical protein n=1 Tax=Paraburkholderia sp. CNPSo 3274 TaxID=2940932 RepID=UPI0020B6EFC9|nr:hypothetical protein [Paraburkholderia sp. CNPSo 3274]MCP3707135.1 hypothetical protein [Paraburkholderia sp. CNPSo 3274]
MIRAEWQHPGSRATIAQDAFNLAARIKQPEDELGIDLFIRERPRLRLHAIGWAFLDYGATLLDLANEARRSATDSKRYRDLEAAK